MTEYGLKKDVDLNEKIDPYLKRLKVSTEKEKHSYSILSFLGENNRSSLFLVSKWISELGYKKHLSKSYYHAANQKFQTVIEKKIVEEWKLIY